MRQNFPKYVEIEEPLLLFIYGRPKHQVKSISTYEPLADEFGLSVSEQEMKTNDGSESRWSNMVRWARCQLLKKAI